MRNLIKTIQNTAFQNGLWQKGSKIVLGVSGGPDSVCLLDIFAKLAPKYDLKLIVAHVNYGLRGKDSNGDEKFVRGLAKKYGLKIEIFRPHPSRHSGRDTFSQGEKRNFVPSENQLREIRYEFFEKVRKENKFDLIAVGHTLDDQAETYLMRIIRGSGLAGLASMKFKTGNIIRPLLGITKKEILEYLNKTDRTYRTDKTNKEISFLRNKIRNRLIPYLEKKYNPNIKKTLFASSLSIADDYDLISKITDKVYSVNKKLSVSKLLKLHPALRKRVLIKTIEEKKLDLKDIETSHIEEVLKVLKSTKSKSQIVIFKGLKITRRGDKIKITNLTTNN